MTNSKMSLNHQDWQTVVLNKKKDTNIEVTNYDKTRGVTVSSVANKPAWKLEQQVDSDVGKPLNFVSTSDANKIIQGRVAMKLSQKDLATRLNMQLKVIQDIESRKAVENKAVLSKIKRFLHVE